MSESSIKDLIKANISPFCQGPEWDAMIEAMSVEGLRQEKLNIAAFKQLSLSTASGHYLDRQIAAVGLSRPEEIGLEDFITRQIAIKITATKQVIKLVHEVLEVFYGADATRAWAVAGSASPYNLTPTDPDHQVQLIFNLDGKTITYEVEPSDFDNNLTAVTAEQLAAAFTKSIRSQGSDGYADVYQDIDTELKYLQVFSGTKGPVGQLRILGGEMQRILDFADVVEAQAASTTWQVSKNGLTVRWTWIGGSAPQLNLLRNGDLVYLYGSDPAFDTNNLRGTRTITNVVPGPMMSAYFEYEDGNAAVVTSVTVMQPTANDIFFQRNTLYRANYRKRYALAWESNSKTLKVYLPAVTRVVKRELEGSAHIHIGKSTSELNKIWGGPAASWSSVTNYTLNSIVRIGVDNYRSLQYNNLNHRPDLSPSHWEPTTPPQIEILTNLSFRIPDRPADVLGFGGLINGSIDIDYLRRENGWLTVVTLEPHLLEPPAYAALSTYFVGDITTFGGSSYQAITTVPPGNPPPNATYWRSTSLTNQTASITGVGLIQDDPVNAFPGAYCYDTEVSYTMSSKTVTLNQNIVAGQGYRIIDVTGTTGLEGQSGYLVLNAGFDTEEHPIPVVEILQGKLLLDPSYEFKFSHKAGEEANMLSSKEPAKISVFGTDYPFYLTGTAAGRIYCQKLIEDVTALGIQLEIIVIYPSGVGLGNGEVSTRGFTGSSEAEPLERTDGEYRNNDLLYCFDE